MIWFLVGLVGLCVGSFFNVLLARLFREEGSFTGRSRCVHCKHELAWYELIPVLSYFMLRGSCRYCGRSISIRYPLVEISTAVIFLAFVYQHGISFDALSIFLFLLAIGLYFIFLFDLFHYLIPDVVLIPFVLGSAAYIFFTDRSDLLSHLTVGLLTSLLFAILYIVSRGNWVGFGDVKLVFLLGLVFGYPFGVLIVIGAIWAAAIVGIILMLVRRATTKTALPFGSFLAAVAVGYILFYHDVQIYRWIF